MNVHLHKFQGILKIADFPPHHADKAFESVSFGQLFLQITYARFKCIQGCQRVVL